MDSGSAVSLFEEEGHSGNMKRSTARLFSLFSHLIFLWFCNLQEATVSSEEGRKRLFLAGLVEAKLDRVEVTLCAC